MPAFLDEDLLHRLEARLRNEEALIADAWAPRLTDAQIDDLLVVRPANPHTFGSRWASICPRRRGVVALARRHPPRRPRERGVHLPLRDVAENHAALGDATLQLYGIDALLRPVGDKPMVYFHCAVPRAAPVRIYTQNDDVVKPRLVLPSISALVLAWIDLIDGRIWTSSPDGTWS